MKLSEIVEKLTEEKPDGSKLYTQTSLAAAIGTNQSAVGQMLAGKTWDDHFEIIVNLIPIALRHDLLEARRLLPADGHDKRRNLETDKGDSSKAGRNKQNVR